VLRSPLSRKARRAGNARSGPGHPSVGSYGYLISLTLLANIKGTATADEVLGSGAVHEA